MNEEYEMNDCANEIKRFMTFVGLSLSLFLILTSCPQPTAAPNNKTSMNRAGADQTITMSVYPDNEIIYYNTFGLFSTTINAQSIDRTIGAFDITLGYDAATVAFESVYSQQFTLNIIRSSGIVTIRSTGGSIGPGDNLELFNVTWKAIVTGITDVAVTVNSLTDSAGLPIDTPHSFSGTITIVKTQGNLSVNGSTYIHVNTDFSNTIHFDTGGAIVKEYDIDVTYDPLKLSPRIPAGMTESIQPGAAGFIDSISAGSGKINIKGSKNTIGPGKNLEFLIADWTTLDPSRTVIGININRMVTSENVFIKPDIGTLAISVFSDDKKPTVDVWIEPGTQSVPIGTHFMTAVYLNTTGYYLEAYGINIHYDPLVLSLDTTGNGVEAGSDGYLTVVNNNNGILATAGFRPIEPPPPQARLQLLKIYWIANKVSLSSDFEIEVRSLVDPRSRLIEKIRITNASVTVTAQ